MGSVVARLSHGSSRCNPGKAMSWSCSARNSSVCSSYCNIPAWGRIKFRWGTAMSNSLEVSIVKTNVMRFLFSLLRIKGLYTFLALLAHNKMGPTFWSIHLWTKIIFFFPQILSDRSWKKVVFKSSLLFKHVLLRSQTCMRLALKIGSRSSFLQRKTSAFLIVGRGTLKADSHIPCRSHAVPLPR
jgi:hypothetical protein